MIVKDVMHSGVVTAQINDSLKTVASMMKREDIGAVPIYKNQRPVGFVTDRDIVTSCVANGHSPDSPISLAMSGDIIYVYQDDDLNRALDLMEKHQISRLLVVDSGEKPVGMLSLHDLSLHFEDKEKEAEVINEIKR
jgi:CBS domain-containing protein